MPIQLNSPPNTPWGSGQTKGHLPDFYKNLKQLLKKLKSYLSDGYRSQRVSEAQGDVSGFNAPMVEYQMAPEVTQHRIYIEHLERLLPRIKHIYFLDGDKGSVLPIMNLSSDYSVILEEKAHDFSENIENEDNF